MTTGKGIKVIVSMIGLDSHTTGAEVVTTLLRDAGFEVVYLGVNQTPAAIVNAAVEEDVDAIGISCHASNFVLIEELMNLVEENALTDVPYCRASDHKVSPAATTCTDVFGGDASTRTAACGADVFWTAGRVLGTRYDRSAAKASSAGVSTCTARRKGTGGLATAGVTSGAVGTSNAPSTTAAKYGRAVFLIDHLPRQECAESDGRGV